MPASAANTYLTPSAGISDPARVARIHARVDGLDAQGPHNSPPARKG